MMFMLPAAGFMEAKLTRTLTEQLKWHVIAALNSFDDLDPVDAIENAKFDLKAILALLNRAGDAVGVSGVEPVEVRHSDEGLIGDSDAGHLADLKKPRLKIV
jgi:hypothetical protein